MPKKQRLGRTGEKHIKKMKVTAAGSLSDLPVVALDMSAGKDTVEDVLADLIDEVEHVEKAWLQKYAELHLRQWREFEESVAQHSMHAVLRVAVCLSVSAVESVRVRGARV